MSSVFQVMFIFLGRLIDETQEARLLVLGYLDDGLLMENGNDKRLTVYIDSVETMFKVIRVFGD